MASIAELAVMITADASQYSRELNSTLGKTQSWASNIGGMATAALGGAALGAATALAGGVAAIGGAAFQVSKDTEVAAANMAASLGIPIEEAEKLAQIAQDVYGNNFADSVIDAGGVVAQAYQYMGDASEKEVQRAVESAVALRDSFGIDTAESLSTVNTLMENLGITSDEAFDFIAKGMQKGLNAQGDMLDSLGEYTNLMGDLGFTAPEVFSLMETGMQGGVLGTDKIMDALKEMGIILNEGADDAKTALASMGLDYDTMARSVASGETTWADYFDSIVSGLNGIEDPIARSQAQVAIFGTQGEDLGVSFTEGLSTASTSMEDMAGAADQLNAKYNTFGDMFAGIWRKAVVSVTPATDKLLELANDAMPLVEAGFNFLADIVPPVIDFVVDAVDKGVEFIKGLFDGPLKEGLDGGVGAFETVQDWIDENMPLIQQTVETVLGAITEFWDNNGERIMSVVDGFLSIVKELFDTYLNNALDIVTMVMQLINGDIDGAGETLKGIVSRTMEAFLSIVSDYIGMVQDAFGDIDWGQVGRNIIDGIIAGLKGAGSLLASAAEGVAEGAVQGIKDLLGIRSPSRVMADEVGGPIIAGLVQGITSNGKDVVSAAEAVINNTLAAMDFATNLDSQFGMFGDVFQGAQLEQYLASLATGISGNLSTLGALGLTGGGFVDGGNNSGMGNGSGITINIYTDDARTAGDSVVQSLRAYGLAA